MPIYQATNLSRLDRTDNISNNGKPTSVEIEKVTKMKPIYNEITHGYGDRNRSD